MFVWRCGKLTNIRAVYGTLKRGFGLHKSTGLNDPNVADYLGTTTLKGFDMWTNGFYPLVKKGKGEITVELYRIKRKSNLDIIDSIEFGAGYELGKTEIMLNGNTYIAGIYIYGFDCSHYSVVSDGNFGGAEVE